MVGFDTERREVVEEEGYATAGNNVEIINKKNKALLRLFLTKGFFIMVHLPGYMHALVKSRHGIVVFNPHLTAGAGIIVISGAMLMITQVSR